MTKTKHTQGWIARCADSDKFIMGSRIETESQIIYPIKDHKMAVLMASAPELLDALKELVELMEGVIAGEYKPDSFTCQPARSAILKSEGIL